MFYHIHTHIQGTYSAAEIERVRQEVLRQTQGGDGARDGSEDAALALAGGGGGVERYVCSMHVICMLIDLFFV